MTPRVAECPACLRRVPVEAGRLADHANLGNVHCNGSGRVLGSLPAIMSTGKAPRNG
jgi:hypothetical protein